jgi:hypothetical protein
LIHASDPPNTMAPVSTSRPVAKPRPHSLSMNAQRNVQPIAKRSSPTTRCSPLVWAGSSCSIAGMSIAVISRVVIVPTSLFRWGQHRRRRGGWLGSCGPIWMGPSGPVGYSSTEPGVVVWRAR